jgi:hypothetical protein
MAADNPSSSANPLESALLLAALLAFPLLLSPAQDEPSR